MSETPVATPETPVAASEAPAMLPDSPAMAEVQLPRAAAPSEMTGRIVLAPMDRHH